MAGVARRKAPELSLDERERNQREAAHRQRERCAEIARAMTVQARAWLVEQGALVPGEGVRERLVRLDRYRTALVQASAPAYRPTVRQLQARPCPGLDVEVEF